VVADPSTKSRHWHGCDQHRPVVSGFEVRAPVPLGFVKVPVKPQLVSTLDSPVAGIITPSTCALFHEKIDMIFWTMGGNEDCPRSALGLRSPQTRDSSFLLSIDGVFPDRPPSFAHQGRHPGFHVAFSGRRSTLQPRGRRGQSSGGTILRTCDLAHSRG
jgi:hypothetical protein